MKRKLLGVIDSDSYAKWGAALLSRLDRDAWQVDLTVVGSRPAASAGQLASALVGTAFQADAVPRATLPEILDRLGREAYDAVFVSTSGAVAEAVITEITMKIRPRPVLLTGLPGISSPAKYKGIFRRAQADLFVLHSHREIREHRELVAARGMTHNFVLATLPFLEQLQTAGAAAPGRRDSIVFAAQPGVPWHLEERQAMAARLVEAARANPGLRVVLKVRALPGELQTHREKYPYPDLLPAGRPANLVVEAGPMSEHLARAVGFVTVSSTAAIEAIAAHVPSIVLTDFGVSGPMINTVFIGSNLLASSDELVAARFREVDPAWRQDNYFHDPAENNWQQQLDALAALRDVGALPDRPAQRTSSGGALRRAWDRKRAFGEHDHTALGYLAATIGYPMLYARRLLTSLRSPASAAPVIDETNDEATEGQVTAHAGRE
ncbi:DUF6716 putative glycosyltransferase [Gryllotalpicola reticulitermitis]|uniref:DUF6716 putative glycosyltransferase n=1 Tax=Gryllotalpicola reticulitermitis TaxID=1184153 RepID=A0ABV8Q4H1_9MICO